MIKRIAPQVNVKGKSPPSMDTVIVPSSAFQQVTGDGKCGKNHICNDGNVNRECIRNLASQDIRNDGRIGHFTKVVEVSYVAQCICDHPSKLSRSSSREDISRPVAHACTSCWSRRNQELKWRGCINEERFICNATVGINNGRNIFRSAKTVLACRQPPRLTHL